LIFGTLAMPSCHSFQKEKPIKVADYSKVPCNFSKPKVLDTDLGDGSTSSLLALPCFAGGY